MKKFPVSRKILILFAILIIVQIFVSSFILYKISLGKAKDYLQKAIQRVEDDVRFNSNKWDISRYVADGVIPDINPLYIITTDGYVIERWKPIHGLLDTSEFNRLISYTEPQTINTVTDESWRILSKQIVNNGKTIAVITVTAYKPELSDVTVVDKQLQDALATIRSHIVIHGDSIDVSKIDARMLPYTITFQIVNTFNQVLIKNDNTTSITRSPTFIDSSYVANQIGSGEKIITDAQTHQTYLIQTTSLYDAHHTIIGIIVVGTLIDSFWGFMGNYILLPTIITILLFLFCLPFVLRYNKQYLTSQALVKNKIEEVKQISFSKKDCKLVIDGHLITIPYASFQYYFCDALFSKPAKRWEVDELLERFGEEMGSSKWHKVYDTMVLLNKKTNQYLMERLFITNNKTYSINPQLLSKIVTSKN